MMDKHFYIYIKPLVFWSLLVFSLDSSLTFGHHKDRDFLTIKGNVFQKSLKSQSLELMDLVLSPG